jgi:hypothetical protein
MRARMREIGIVGLASMLLADCALPSAMPVAPVRAARRVSFPQRVTVPAFRYDARETPEATIAGRVIDDSTGLPVRLKVAAWLTERSDSTAADAWGHFDLSNVAPGRYTLVTWADGYEPRVDAVDVRAESGVAVELRLKRQGAMLAQRAVPARGSAVRVVAAASGSGMQ